MLKIVKTFVNNVLCYFQVKSEKIIAESTCPFHISALCSLVYLWL